MVYLNSAGESVDISDGDTESVALTESSGLREKMVYMSVGDSHHNQGNHGESVGSNDCDDIMKLYVSSF